jgi:hypothetical protein
MSNVDTLIRKFASDIADAVKEDWIAALRAARLPGSPRNGPAPKSRKTSAPRRSPVKRAPSAGGKRSPAELESLRARIVAAVLAHPGQRAEELARALDTSTADLALPLRQLVDDKTLGVKGKARGSRYTAR